MIEYRGDAIFWPGNRPVDALARQKDRAFHFVITAHGHQEFAQCRVIVERCELVERCDVEHAGSVRVGRLSSSRRMARQGRA